ncbi:MAG: hypothetical protein A2406_01180 [Candidatus Komeilibacteria bacterium RIFOXYC1_FULL_37_11]|uniref:Uncharacterized protein n=1 Tax=Candidatus Komeilibacteria bacterium RIFOXYC1_FULL_37_11 TaxID=1798555 RepID=A0A1G2BVR1_9BACT|nr:MAG: hypothetical protein A2406_01180 [Candidatus Komeilibacteria bacterium RIFOXYC1_FULL_37_11]OGY95758.1 MAG: hypothetical protein A2611_03205 [Candidatus Komeilibacteria bacterium RIFOXYD1_FULL_37_29]OGY97162.1 MAG: hypothetical protein A2543_02300 [Candidatus Komeilibacteria bacterium RIFOXYD2_FULL_37_8]
MAKSTDKKTTILLLVILAVSVIGGGIWTYSSLKPIEPTQNLPVGVDSLMGLSIDNVYAIKEQAIANIGDFLETPNSSDTLWDYFYSNQQFNKLNDINLDINIGGYVNNPNPFVIPSSTEENS